MRFGYNPNGNLTSLTVPSGADHGWEYNAVDLGAAYLTPLSGSYGFEYDRDRRLTTTTYPSGKVAQNIYADGRLAASF